MHHSHPESRALGFLLGLTDEETARRVRTRVGLTGGARETSASRRQRLNRPWTWPPDVPSSVVLWVLQEDDPQLNAVVWQYTGLDTGLRRALARGIPFGPGRERPLRPGSRLPVEEPGIPESYVRHGLVGALRAATTMATGRAAASMVLTPDDWASVTEADAERALPGYARWALSVRPDCPPATRAGFGAHPKFAHRLRGAGVLDGPAEYALDHGPAVRVLDLLSMGGALFPARIGEAEDALRPLVGRHLGDRVEAWTALARLIGTFRGTARELTAAAGAVARNGARR
ncbi:hypothetical protein [Streptomyces sp. NPDC002553]|uniref:hypothetical protein n=1 Tax=Streptomyces sp. NPDC002553 TaxID=3154417 RepID=UPI003327A90C